MTASGVGKRILIIASKSDAQPVLGQLRSAGHQVSFVEDADEARLLLGFAGFDQALLPAAQLAALLDGQWLWESGDAGSWRRSTAALAHDLQGLLTALERSIADVDSGAPGKVGEFRHTVSTLATFLHELTAEMTGRLADRLDVTGVDLEDAVEAAAVVVYLAAAERRQRLIVDIDDRVRVVPADAGKLKRVLKNLLDHASRHAPMGGAVTVRACAEDTDCIISVSHTGEHTATAALRGSARAGAGADSPPASELSQVQRLVEQLGGRLWIESQKGQGTALFVSLPLEPEDSGSALALTALI